MTYADQTWGQRLNTMGDYAEGVFEEVAPLGSYVRFGFNRPPFKMTRLSDFMRHTPDYVTGTGHLVEVMGCGQDNMVKLRPEKYEALKLWNKHGDVMLFLWNSNMHEWALIQWDQLKRLFAKAKRSGEIQSFNDGNQYWPIPWEWIEGTFPYGG